MKMEQSKGLLSQKFYTHPHIYSESLGVPEIVLTLI